MTVLPQNSTFDVQLFHPVFENFSRRYHGDEKGAEALGFLVFSADHHED